MEEWQKKGETHIRVEAVRLNEDNAEAVARWCGGELVEEIDPMHGDETQPGINVFTSKNVERASLHNYVVRIGRNFYVLSNRYFESLYEPVNRPSPPLESAGDTRRELGFADPFDRGKRDMS